MSNVICVSCGRARALLFTMARMRAFERKVRTFPQFESFRFGNKGVYQADVSCAGNQYVFCAGDAVVLEPRTLCVRREVSIPCPLITCVRFTSLGELHGAAEDINTERTLALRLLVSAVVTELLGLRRSGGVLESLRLRRRYEGG